MNRNRAVVVSLIFLLIGGAGILTWVMWVQPEHPDESAAAPASAQSKTENPRSKISAPEPEASPEVSEFAKALNSPSTDIRADLRLVSNVIESYRTNFLQTGNPSGSNAEITAALTGKNQLRFAFFPPNHPAINRDGELCDRWGTPFFFHSESATKMEIRSAGPDKKMWSTDDVVFAP